MQSPIQEGTSINIFIVKLFKISHFFETYMPTIRNTSKAFSFAKEVLKSPINNIEMTTLIEAKSIHLGLCSAFLEINL